MNAKAEADMFRQGSDVLPHSERTHKSSILHTKQYLPAECSSCGAVFKEGRWQWVSTRPIRSNSETCPACQRIDKNIPAGYLSLSGSFFIEHRDEILNLVRHKVSEQEPENPMGRIIGIEDSENGGLMITFTDIRLPYDVGKNISDVYKGKLMLKFPRGTDLVNAEWVR